MKKYHSRAEKWMLIISLICAAALAAGIFLISISHPNLSLKLALTIMGGLNLIWLLPCYFATRSRRLIIDNEKIILSKGALRNGKTHFKKTPVRFDEISSLGIQYHDGDGIISLGTAFYTLTLKDGTKITVTLYEFGKAAEQEIINTVRQRIAQSK